MLREETLFGYVDKVAIAIERLRAFEPEEGYYLAFSGGKDSQAIYHLALQAGVKFDAHYNVTTADPPEVVCFIRDHYPDVRFERADTTMWRLIAAKAMPPTRLVRYCCESLKEHGGDGRFVVTGVRWAESTARSHRRGSLELNAYSKHVVVLNSDNDEARRMMETCELKSKHVLNPIIDWEDSDVWEYLREIGVESCSLYAEGYKRIGCVSCPMTDGRRMRRDLERWPTFKAAYLHAFEKMLVRRRERGLKTSWQSPEEVMDWWTEQMTWAKRKARAARRARRKAETESAA